LPFKSKYYFTLKATSNMVTMQSPPDAHSRDHKRVMDFQKYTSITNFHSIKCIVIPISLSWMLFCPMKRILFCCVY
jgi:hypothetical protein